MEPMTDHVDVIIQIQASLIETNKALIALQSEVLKLRAEIDGLMRGFDVSGMPLDPGHEWNGS